MKAHNVGEAVMETEQSKQKGGQQSPEVEAPADVSQHREHEG